MSKRHIQSKYGFNKLCEQNAVAVPTFFFLYPQHKKTCLEFIENIESPSYCQQCGLVAVGCRLRGLLL